MTREEAIARILKLGFQMGIPPTDLFDTLKALDCNSAEIARAAMITVADGMRLPK